MGVTYRAFTVVGSKIDRGKVFKEIDVRACEHALPDEGAKFCPECGKKAHRKETEWIPAYSDEYHHGYDCDGTLAKLPVFDAEYEDFILVAGGYAKVNSYDDSSIVMLSQPDGAELMVAAAKKKVKDALEPLGLWDEDRFGIWLMMSGYG